MDPRIACFFNWPLLQPRECLLHVIAYHAAPVLEQHKPSVILTFSNSGARRLSDWWLEYQNDLPAGRLQYDELCRSGDGITVLFYDPDLLARVLAEKATARFLQARGYGTGPSLTVDSALAVLRSKYPTGCPHEIGLFLGIPLADVQGFIRFEGKHALANGCWKVYHDPDRKLALFARFDEAKLGFIRFILAGHPAGEYLSGGRLTTADGM
jgi:hypothetical protein